MSDYTPGPWIIGNPPPNGELAIGNQSGTMVAIATTGFCCPTAANARLIAAAPDLLADLKEAATTFRRYEVLHRAKGTPESTEKAEANAALAERFEATIAKATGDHG